MGSVRDGGDASSLRLGLYGDPVISLILKLIALRPLLSMAIFGVPVLALIAIGAFTLVALKVLIFVIIPLIAVIWLYRRSKRP